MSDRLAERIARCRDRHEADPTSGVFVLLADLLRERGDHGEALAVLDEGARHRPGSLAAQVVRGRTLMEAGRAEEARPVLEAVLARDAGNLVALRLLAEDGRSRADWARALPHLERLAELDPDDARWSAALEEARAFRERPAGDEPAPQAGFATLTLVDIYLAQGYHGRAVDALRQMAEREPERGDVRARLADLEAAAPRDAATEATPPPPAPRTDAAARADRRAVQKRQFEAWLESLGREEEAP